MKKRQTDTQKLGWSRSCDLSCICTCDSLETQHSILYSKNEEGVGQLMSAEGQDHSQIAVIWEEKTFEAFCTHWLSNRKHVIHQLGKGFKPSEPEPDLPFPLV